MIKILMILSVVVIGGMAIPASAYEANYYYEARPSYNSNSSYGYSNDFEDWYSGPAYSYYQGANVYASHPRYAEPSKKRLYGGGQIIRSGEYCPGSMGYIYNPYTMGVSYTCY